MLILMVNTDRIGNNKDNLFKKNEKFPLLLKKNPIENLQCDLYHSRVVCGERVRVEISHGKSRNKDGRGGPPMRRGGDGRDEAPFRRRRSRLNLLKIYNKKNILKESLHLMLFQNIKRSFEKRRSHSR